MNLTSWQKTQATLLYEFSSISYLKEMQSSLNDLIRHVENILDLAKNQDRDAHLHSSKWDSRDTSENWSSNAWPFLKNFQLTTSRQLAERALEKYNITGTNQFERGIAEYSTQWASTEEEQKLKFLIERVASYSNNIDYTLDKNSLSSKWNDFNLTKTWAKFKDTQNSIPLFRIRDDILVESSKTPPRTGVYICVDDPNASLQFAWAGDTRGKLLAGKTFNALGISALNFVGRDDLWTNGEKMLQFVLQNKNDPLLKNDAFYSDSKTAVLSPSLVARNAFTTISGRWSYVELIHGEFENDNSTSQIAHSSEIKIAGGQICTLSGYYFTPAKSDSGCFF
jgi:hypothetical protein